MATYPECVCRTCNLTFLDVGPYATFPGPALCPVCFELERAQSRRRSARRGR